MKQLNQEWLQTNGLYKCPYCDKEYTKKGICSHIWRMHTDGKTHKTYNGKKVAWNKGLTKYTNTSVANAGQTLSNKIKQGIIKPGFLNKKHTIKTRNIISKKLSKNNKDGRCKWYDYIKPNGDLIKLQGTWELRFAKILIFIDPNWIKPGVGCKSHSFIWIDNIGNKHTYTPDFYSPKLNKYFEIKGYWWGNDKLKMQYVISQNLHVEIEIVTKHELIAYEKLWSSSADGQFASV